MMGTSGCLTVLLMAVACLRGVLAPEAGGVLPAELSEDLFSTEHRRLRSPRFTDDGEHSLLLVAGRAGSVFCLVGVSVSGWGSGAVFAGDSDSWGNIFIGITFQSE